MPEAEGEKQTCFVIMPFTKELQPVYERIYEPVILACGLKPVRVDGIFRAGLITKDIFDGIQTAALVLADLTGANPNVYYELGIAHRERKPVILTAQEIERDIRFDVKTLRVIEYKRGADDFWNDKLRDDLTKAITSTLADPLSAIATPWLGPIAADSSSKTTTPIETEVRQVLDIVTSLHSMSSRQMDGPPRRALQEELDRWRLRAEKVLTDNRLMSERQERLLAELTAMKSEIDRLREVAAGTRSQSGDLVTPRSGLRFKKKPGAE